MRHGTAVRLLRLVRLTGILLIPLLGACASAPPATSRLALLHDELFGPAPQPVDAAAIFALSDEMRVYADTELQQTQRRPDPRRALVDALYSDRGLRLGYDASTTRNASEAYAARSGNCLSLVIMTAAFARHLGLPVGYQQVIVDDQHTRLGDLTFVSGHVNLVLERRSARSPFDRGEAQDLTIDFLPQRQVGGYRSEPLAEATIVAMFMNNRAAEAISRGRLDEAYGWAAAAVRHDPGFGAGINTLAVVYLRAGHLGAAEAALRAVLETEPDQTTALSNLVQVLRLQGRDEQARLVDRRLTRLQPYPPFHFLDQGRIAMRAGDWRRARELFERELDRQPDQHEAHFWAAQADWRLGDHPGAVRHLRLALANSTTPASHALYAAKLDHLRAAGLQ